jgi:hypothetical protein
MSNDTCSIEDCGKRVLSRGWCGMHYQRWSKHGDPEKTLMPTRVNGNDSERFYPKTDPPDVQGCRLWTGTVDSSGYGRFLFEGRLQGAHRVAYMLEVGSIPDGLDLDHTCHTEDVSCPGGVTCKHRRCTTSSHLEPVQNVENVRRGRSPSAKNAVKTHCKNNHPFNEVNTYVNPDGRRQCKVCRRAVDKARWPDRYRRMTRK